MLTTPADLVKLRPAHHRSTKRMKAHVFICLLSYLLERTVEWQVEQAGVEATWGRVHRVLQPLRWNGQASGRKITPRTARTHGMLC